MVPDCNGNKNKTSLLSSTKKRGWSTLDKRPLSQRHRKRCCFLSPLYSDDESVISRYTPFKPYHISTPQLTSLHLSRFERNVSNDKIKLAGSQSGQCPILKTTVIYEQQS